VWSCSSGLLGRLRMPCHSEQDAAKAAANISDRQSEYLGLWKSNKMWCTSRRRRRRRRSCSGCMTATSLAHDPVHAVLVRH
jgi:hypothetical protein